MKPDRRKGLDARGARWVRCSGCRLLAEMTGLGLTIGRGRTTAGEKRQLHISQHGQTARLVGPACCRGRKRQERYSFVYLVKVRFVPRHEVFLGVRNSLHGSTGAS